MDPIYQQLKGKEIIFNQKDLGLALKRKVDSKIKQSLQNFAQDFYTPFDIQKLKLEMQ